MNVNPLEWAKARDLLVKLAQVLEPFTFRVIAPSFFLNRSFRFLSKEQIEAKSFFAERPVQLLTTLQSIQKEIGKLEGKDPLEPIQKQNDSNRELLSPSSLKKPDPLPVFSPLVEKGGILLRTVVECIGKLSNSAYLKKPNHLPFVEALLKVKPNLDQLIEGVEKVDKQLSSLSIAEEGKNCSLEKKKLGRFSSIGIEPEKKPIDFIKRNPRSPFLPQDRGGQRKDRSISSGWESSKVKKEEFKIKKQLFFSPQNELSSKNTLENKTLPSPSLGQEKEGQPQLGSKPVLKNLDPIALLAAPFTPEIRRLVFDKKKKKRNKLWFKKEKKEESP